MSPHARRTLLRSAPLVLLSGCLVPDDDASPPKSTDANSAPYLSSFVLWNRDGTTHTLSLVVRAGDRTLLDVRRDLDPGESVDVENPIDEQGRYVVEATIETGVGDTFEWRVNRCENIEYVQVEIERPDEIAFRTMRQTIDPPPTC